MKRLLYVFYIAAAVLLFSGCADKTVHSGQSAKQFRFYGVNNFEFLEFYTADGYHTPSQIRDMLNKRVVELLIEKNLLSIDKTADAIGIDVKYTRRYIGDNSDKKTYALSYPFFSYSIKIINGFNFEVKTVEKKNVPFKGSLSMNMKLIASQLTDKQYEKEFIESFANIIVNDIEKLIL
ncbi:MAG: hypothetical protein LBS26_02565 [Campylobacteraceae bacterium]|jgi:hypothetical protein|nr:hypothetical protein [Campylobacteraceae bacterium]